MSNRDFSKMLYRRRMAEAKEASWRASNKACGEPVITAKTKITRHEQPKVEDAPSIFRSMPLGSTLEG